MSRFLYVISHPAHFHMFKWSIDNLKQSGHSVLIVVRPKDVLEQLCVNQGWDFIKIKNRPQKYGIIGLGYALLVKELQVYKIARKFKPDLLIGSDGVLAHVGSLLNIPSFEFSEDDVRVIKIYALLSFPFYTHIVCPNICDIGKWSRKKVGYSGFQKLAYLHPNYFSPDRSVVEKYFSTVGSYFLLRFAKLNAHHDDGINGISTDIAQRLIEILSKYGDIYITSERELEPQFERFRLNINPLDIHHVMAFAKLYIGDSQSMAVEAAMLGVPSIRFSSFAGRIGVLEELEHKYELTHGISPKFPDRLYELVEKLSTLDNLQVLYQQRRNKMLDDKIDVTAFFTWFIENYPESKKVIKENPDYQYRFK